MQWNTTVTGKNNEQTMVIQTWVFGRHFLKNEVGLSLQGKYLIIFVANGKIRPFEQKFQFLKTRSCYYKLNAPQNLKTFLIILVVI